MQHPIFVGLGLTGWIAASVSILVVMGGLTSPRRGKRLELAKELALVAGGPLTWMCVALFLIFRPRAK